MQSTNKKSDNTDYLPITRQIFSIYLNVKCNQRELPTYFPKRAFEEIDIMVYDFAMLQGRIHVNTLKDLNVLNTYLIGKLGRKKLMGSSALKGWDLDLVNKMREHLGYHPYKEV